MSTAQRPPGYDLLPFGDLIFDCEPEIGKASVQPGRPLFEAFRAWGLARNTVHEIGWRNDLVSEVQLAFAMKLLQDPTEFLFRLVSYMKSLLSLSCGLTLAVTGRRPDEACHVQSDPQTGGGHVHGTG